MAITLLKDTTPPTTVPPVNNTSPLHTDQWNKLVDILSGTDADKIVNTALETAVYAAITGLGVQTQALDMGTNQIKSVVDPTLDQDVATKKYVDDQTHEAQTPWTTDQDAANFDLSNLTLLNTKTVANTVYNDQANTYSGGGTQNFGTAAITGLGDIVQDGPVSNTLTIRNLQDATAGSDVATVPRLFSPTEFMMSGGNTAQQTISGVKIFLKNTLFIKTPTTGNTYRLQTSEMTQNNNIILPLLISPDMVPPAKGRNGPATESM